MFYTNLLSLTACLYRKKPKSCSLLYGFGGLGVLAHITLLNVGRSFYVLYTLRVTKVRFRIILSYYRTTAS